MEDAGSPHIGTLQHSVSALFAFLLATHRGTLGGPQPAFATVRSRSVLKIRRACFSMLNVPALLVSSYGIPAKEFTGDEARKRGIVTLRKRLPRPTKPLLWIRLESTVVGRIGFEAGGHRGSFLRCGRRLVAGTFSLVPQTVGRGKGSGSWPPAE